MPRAGVGVGTVVAGVTVVLTGVTAVGGMVLGKRFVWICRLPLFDIGFSTFTEKDRVPVFELVRNSTTACPFASVVTSA